MERFHPEPFIDLSGTLGLLRLAPTRGPSFLGIYQVWEFKLYPGLINALREDLPTIERLCVTHGLKASAKTARYAAEYFSSPKPSWEGARRLAEELHGRLFDEMSSTTFLSLEQREAECYREPKKGWESILEHYPSVIRDVEEAGKCLSLGRATASVFHLMRIIEVGLRSLGKSLNDPSLDPMTNPSWDAILRKCEKELQKPRSDRAPEWRADDVFFAAATTNLRAIQYGWRNPTLHIENSYNEEEAGGIYDAVRTFMKHLATRLSE